MAIWENGGLSLNPDECPNILLLNAVNSVCGMTAVTAQHLQISDPGLSQRHSIKIAPVLKGRAD
jgi:hypothetical protein